MRRHLSSTWKRAHTTAWLHHHPDLTFPAFRNLRNIFLLLLKPSSPLFRCLVIAVQMDWDVTSLNVELVWGCGRHSPEWHWVTWPLEELSTGFEVYRLWCSWLLSHECALNPMIPHTQGAASVKGGHLLASQPDAADHLNAGVCLPCLQNRNLDSSRERAKQWTCLLGPLPT